MKRANEFVSVIVALAAVLAAGAYEVTPNTKIVVPDRDTTGVGAALKEAASELSLDIEEATGWKLPVVEASKAGDTAGAILIGETFAAGAGLVPSDLKFFDNVIAEKGGRLYLFGHDKPGRTSKPNLRWTVCVLPSVKAVTDFECQFMGVRYILPGRTGTEIPKRDRISVPDGFRRVSRPFMENGAGRFYGMMYSIANNIFGYATYEARGGGHTYHLACPDGKYFKDHPEYFAMKNGKRVVGKGEGYSALCISNPDVKKLLVAYILSKFDEGADAVELGQQDSGNFCECENCKVYGGPDAKTPGEKHWIFHRAIAEELYQLRPEKTVLITSYWLTDCRPATFREFPPNVMIELMTYSEEVFAEWSDYVVPRGFSVYTYMWGEYQQPGFTCKMSTPVMARLARRFLKHRVRSIYRCGYGELFGCEGPGSYVFNRLLDDPAQDENALFEEYIEAAYGPAAAHMRKFHRAYDERVAAWAECFNNNRQWPWPREQTGLNTINAIYTPAMLNLCEASLAAAEKTPGLSAKAARRLKLVRSEFAYAKLTAEVCMLFDAYRIAPSSALLDDIDARVEKRRALVASFFDAKGHAKCIDGWPEYCPFGTRCTKELVMQNGRLFAPLYEPFNWDFAKMRKALAKSGNAKKTAKAVAKGKDAAWHDIGGMTFGTCDYNTRFRCFYDDANFYVEVDAELPDAMTFTPKGHDGTCYRQECLELFIDPLFQATRCFHFIWNPVEDSYLEEAYGLVSDPLDPDADKFKLDWDGKWCYSVTRGNGRWHSLVTVPFASLGVKKPLPGMKWHLNLGRETYKKDELQLQLWNPSLSGRGMRDLDSMGIVTFE